MSAALIPSSIPCLNTPTLHRLANGLTIIAEQIPVDAVNLSLWLPVGSAVESDTINGMAHFLEHMVFKGTPQLVSGEFERLIEERGAVTNAATSQDYTHYFITTAPQDFAELAPLQMDVVLNASIPEAAFERERLVVLEEIRRSEDNPRRRTFQRAIETAFERLPYRRSVLGPAAVVNQLTPQQMRTFHHTWYQPSGMTAVAVGNLPVDTLIQTVIDGVQQPTDGARLHPCPQDQPGVEPAFREIVRQEWVDDSLQQARLVMVWRVPGLQQQSQTYALDVLASILGHGRTARLIQDLREHQQLVSSISASNMSHVAQGVFYIAAQLPTEHLATVETAIAQQIRRLQAESVSTTEINRVRTQVVNRFVFGNETPSDRANLYGYYHALMGELESALDYPAQIQALTAADLQTAAQTYLSPDAYGVVIVRPQPA